MNEEYNIIRLQESIKELETCLEMAKVSLLRIQSNIKPLIKSQKEKIEFPNYVDLDNIKNEKGIWELYDENQWNK